MRILIINFLKKHEIVLTLFYFICHQVLRIVGRFLKVREKTMVFASFGGRRFDDSPRAIYEEICHREEFDDWDLIWVFVEPERFQIDRGRKIKVDTWEFFKTILSAKVWISNSGMDRGLNICKKETISIETWHGTPLKKIEGEEHSKQYKEKKTKIRTIDVDKRTIRCAQSEYDQQIFQRVFHASKEAILLCDLPRNDRLLSYTGKEVRGLKQKLKMPENKKVILYMPTYREYLLDMYNACYFTLPINFEKWKEELQDDYVILFRAHYAVTKVLNIKFDEFLIDVSEYEELNDLYIVADLLISDYSSAYFDFSILKKPMLCFAYDLEEYIERRGLYLNIENTLPCPIDREEEALLERIKTLDFKLYSKKTEEFAQKYAPNAGKASKTIVNMLIQKVKVGGGNE